MKDLKYEHQSTFPLWGRVKLNFRHRYRKLNSFSKNSSCNQVFHQILENCNFGVKRNHYPPRWICMTHIWSPTLLPRGKMIFQGVLNKFPFFIKFPYLEKIVNLRKDLKYEHQSTFPLWGRVKLNFRDRYRKPNIYSKNSSCCQVFFTGLSKNDFGIVLQTLTHP